MISIFHAETDEHWKKAWALIVECTSDHRFERAPRAGAKIDWDDIEPIPGDYVPPDGCMLLLIFNMQTAGCAGMLRMDQTTMELRRLYIRHQFRRKGIGRRLAQAAIEEARRSGCERMVASLTRAESAAENLLVSLGFSNTAGRASADCSSPSLLELSLG
jgi:GNAT superfamily N-acetyltransferase